MQSSREKRIQMMAEIMANRSESTSDDSSTFDSDDAEIINIENKQQDKYLRQQEIQQEGSDSSSDKSMSTAASSMQLTTNQTQNAKIRAKKFEKQQKQMEIQHISDRETLIKKIQGNKNKGAKLSDENYTSMLAQNIVYNRNLRLKQSSQLAQDAIQEQELFEKQQAIFTDYKPYLCRIQAASFIDAYKGVLQQSMGYATVNILVQCFEDGKSFQDFKTMTQQDLPDGLTYDQLKQSYNQTVIAQQQYNQMLSNIEECEELEENEVYKQQLYNFPNIKNFVKVEHKEGKITKIPKSIDIFNEEQLLRVTKGEISKDELITEKLISQAKNEEEIQQIKQNQVELQRQRDHLVESIERNKEQATYQKEFKREVAEFSKREDRNKGLYNRTYFTGQFKDQSKYQITPNSISIQTDVSLIGSKIKIPQYKILLDQAKRSQFQVYCVLRNGQVSTSHRNVQTQTEILARQVKNGEINIRHYNVQVAEVVAYIDQERLPLVKIDIKSVEQKLKDCKTVRIVKPKGKAPQGLTDFIILLRKVRPDIAAQGDQLYKQSEDEVKKIATIPNGCWPTLDGVLEQKDEGIYQMAETPQHNFAVYTNDILQIEVTNGHELPAFVDKFYPVIDDTQEQNQQQLQIQEYAEEFYEEESEYIESLTGLEYSTMEEYNQIQQIIEKEKKLIQQNIDMLQQEKQKLLSQQKFQIVGQITNDIKKLEYNLYAITEGWKHDQDLVIYDKQSQKFQYRLISEKRQLDINQVETILCPWLAY